MPVYYFASVAPERVTDDDGVDLPDDAAARRLAAEFAGEILKTEPETIWQAGSVHVEVTNDIGTVLFAITAVPEPATA